MELLWGDIPERVDMDENGLRFQVSLREGQKTGGFLDQKQNHLLLKEISAGKKVLDCFCYTGGWAVHAAKFGAQSVLGVDISARAVGQASSHAKLNKMSDRVRFEECDAFERLRSLHQEGTAFRRDRHGPPRLRQEPQEHRRGDQRVSDRQPPRPGTAGAGRLPDHLLLLVPHGARSVPRHADPGGTAGKARGSAGGDLQPGGGSSGAAVVSGVGISEMLCAAGGVICRIPKVPLAS